MKNTRRRKRRKNPSRTRCHSGKRAVQALAAGAVIAAGTQAYAEPIRFDNPAEGSPGHYHWPPLVGDNTQWLDLLAPATEQPGDGFGPGEESQVRQLNFGTYGVAQGAPAGADLQVGGPYGIFLVGVDGGELIPSGAPWSQEGFINYPGFGSQLPEGQATYLGVRFDLGAGYQYGLDRRRAAEHSRTRRVRVGL